MENKLFNSVDQKSSEENIDAPYVLLYRHVLVNLNHKKVYVYNSSIQKDEYYGQVMGALEKYGKYIYLVAFMCDINFRDFLKVKGKIEEVTFFVNKPIFDAFLSNFYQLDEKIKLIKNFDLRFVEHDSLFPNDKPLTLKEVKSEGADAFMYDDHFRHDDKKWDTYNLQLWVAMDSQGNILDDPHEYFSWKPYEDKRKYKHADASGKNLYQYCGYIRDYKTKLKHRSDNHHYCGMMIQKATNKLFGVSYGWDLYTRISVLKSYPDGMNISQEDFEMFLRDDEIARRLEGKNFWIRYPDKDFDLFEVKNGKLQLVYGIPKLGYAFVVCNKDGYPIPRGDYDIVLPGIAIGITGHVPPITRFVQDKENSIFYDDFNSADWKIIDPKIYLEDWEVMSFNPNWSKNHNFFVCGLMRQKSTDKSFYLSLVRGYDKILHDCACSFSLSLGDLKILLKDKENVREFEGETFEIPSTEKELVSIRNGEIVPKEYSSFVDYFTLQDENGVIFCGEYTSTDWELLASKA